MIPDLGALTRPLRAAIRGGKVRPRRRKQLWATEISWDTRPPDPTGIPLARHGQYVQGAFYTLWRQGVNVVTWFLMRDKAPGRGYGFTLQSGIFFRGSTVAQDRPKPHTFQAFRFPFTAYRRRGVAQLWGLAPSGGRVVIERRGVAAGAASPPFARAGTGSSSPNGVSGGARSCGHGRGRPAWGGAWGPTRPSRHSARPLPEVRPAALTAACAARR